MKLEGWGGRGLVRRTARAGVSCRLQITSENSAFSLSSLFVGPRRKRKYIITRDESPRYPTGMRTYSGISQLWRFSGTGCDRRKRLRGCTAHRFRIAPALALRRAWRRPAQQSAKPRTVRPCGLLVL